MLNVQALNQTLSAMSLPQLQQYAALHKDDPYVVTMALSIANMKKQAMTAQQGQAGQQPMPKVVDQEIAQMAPQPRPQPQMQQMPPQQGGAPLPEEVGIGQLPAPNIAKMAGGGIVAFGDGGEVPRYQVGGGILGDIPGYQPQGTFSPQAGAPEEPSFLRKKIMELQNKVAAGTATPQEKAWVALFGSKEPSVSIAQQDPFAFTQPAAPEAPTSPVKATPSGAAAASATPDKAAETPIATKNPFVVPQVKMPGFKPSEAPTVPTAEDLRSRYNTLLGADPTKDPFAAQQMEINRATEAGKRRGIEALEADIKAAGEYGQGQERRLSEREAKLSKDEGINAAMGFLQAGLGILGGTSPFFGVNVGQGAQKGTEAFMKGQEKIDAARERLDDARTRLEDLRRNESMMNRREVRAAKADLENTLVQGQRDLLAGTRQAYGHNSQLANTMLSIQANAEDSARKIASAEKLGILDAQTRIAIANKPGENMQIASILGGGNLEKGMVRMAEIQAGKWDPRNAYTQYMLGWNKNAQANPLYAQENPMLNFSQFIGAFAIPTGGGASEGSMAGKDRARPGM